MATTQRPVAGAQRSVVPGARPHKGPGHCTCERCEGLERGTWEASPLQKGWLVGPLWRAVEARSSWTTLVPGGPMKPLGKSPTSVSREPWLGWGV